MTVFIFSHVHFFFPESAQGVLSWTGYHGDVREESRAVWRVLESRSGDVVEALQL